MKGKIPWASIAASTVIAAVISGGFAWDSASRVERLKYELGSLQERAKKLGQAHAELLSIKQAASFSAPEMQGNPDETIVRLTKIMTANFNTAEAIYLRIRPLLSNADRTLIESKYSAAESANKRVSELL